MKLGRLFWKFFIFLWLAQLVTAIGVGVMIWTHRNEYPGGFPPPPPPHELRTETGEPSAGMTPRPPPPHRSIFPPLMPIVMGGIVSLLFAWLLALYFSRPIRTLQDAFEAEAGGKLDTRIGAKMGIRQDELADLGKDFDRMAERLQALVEGQRRLLHDVSHELRSPLARLQAAAGLLQQQPERAEEFLERIQRDTGRIDTLVGELLTLARLDAGMDANLRETFDLAEVIEDLAEDVRFEVMTKGGMLDLALENNLLVTGNIEMLRRAFENVLRNAVRHTPEGTIVTVTGKHEQGFAVVEVIDAGAGLADTDLETIFEPFYRAENSKPFEGYGLGLTIARQVMKLHEGSIKAANLASGGFAVTLRLPLAV
jgi:two-component system, OmpR family, sensor kinase